MDKGASYQIIKKEEEAKKCAEVVYRYLKSNEQTFYTEEDLKKLFSSQNSLTLYAEVSEKIVGLVSGIISPSPMIRLLVVLDEDQAKKGLGGDLIDKFVETVKKLVPTAKIVSTVISNEQNNAISLYLMKGFTISGFVYEEDRGIVVLRRRI